MGDIGRSCVYEGWVRHRRFSPVKNAFRYRIFLMYIDLAALPEVFDGYPLWSARRWALAWFRRADYHGPRDVPLDVAVRDTVEKQTGVRPQGPICLLTHCRYWGYVFNPVSFYYIFDDAGTRVTAIMLEITNTPWSERRTLVFPCSSEGDGRMWRFCFSKDFHVSPFMQMDIAYDWRLTSPGERISVHMINRDAPSGVKVFDATLSLRARPFSRMRLIGVLVRYPFMTMRVIFLIHFQALRLYIKGARFYRHPSKRGVAYTKGIAPPHDLRVPQEVKNDTEEE